MEDFNIIDDFIQDQNKKRFYNSNAYKTLKANNIDTAELEGINPDPEAGEVKFKDTSEEEKNSFATDALDFVGDVLKEDLIAITKSGVNAAQALNNIVAFVGYGNNPLPEDSMFRFVNEKADAQKEKLNQLQEELDNPLLMQLQAMILQDAAFTAPIYKKLISIGVPRSKAMPISFALGGALAFDKTESLFVDTNAVNGLKEVASINEDSPAGEIYDKTIQALEYGSLGFLGDKVFKGLSKLKNITAGQGQQLATTTAATAGVAAVTPEAEASPMSVLGQKLIKEGGKKIVGISKQQGDKVPTTFEQRIFAKSFEDNFKNDPNITNFKVDDSFGKFGDNIERNLDVEILTKPGFDNNSLIKTAVNAAEKENQEAVIVASSSIDKVNATPSVSINFKNNLYKSNIEDLIGEFDNDFSFKEGFTAKTKLLTKEGLPFTMEFLTPDRQLVDNIKKLYPVTTEFNKAGFLLPDGTVVNMNRQTNIKGGAVEHRDAAVRAMGGAKPGTAEQLYDFMQKTNAIRISPYGNRMFGQIYHKPTKAQIDTIRKMNEAGYDEIIIDAYDPGMGAEMNLFINKPERSVNKVYELLKGEKFDAAKLEQTFDAQTLDVKEYQGIRSMYIPDFSNIKAEDFAKKVLEIDKKYGKDFEVNAELFDLNVITKKDYGKYR